MEGNGKKESSAWKAKTKTEELDAPLHALGFQIGHLSPHRVTGHLLVNKTCIQGFGVLHGGVSAVVAEGLASMGAHMASGFQRVAGIQLSINHLKPAQLGDEIFAEALPIHVGKTTQLWEVKLWKTESSVSEKRTLIASSRVTLVANLPVPESAREAQETLRRHAKL